MTIFEAIECANKSVNGIRNFRFAQITEFNSYVDSFKFEDWPIHILVPFIITGVPSQPGGRIVKTVQVDGFFMKRIPEDTNNWRSPKIEQEHIQPMRKLCEDYLIALIRTDDVQMINREAQLQPWTIRPEFMFTAQHALGVSYSVLIPIVDAAC